MKTRTLLCIMLILSLLLAVLAGCQSAAPQTIEPPEDSGPPEQSAPPPSDSGPPQPPQDDVSAPPDAPPVQEGEAGDEAAESYQKIDYSLPLFEQTEEISLYWVLLGGMGGSTQLEKKDLDFTQRCEENLGVKLTYVQNGEAVNNEKYNLMIASRDMTDIIWESNCGTMGATSVYPGGYDKAIDDEVYIQLNELLPQYAPNYYHYLMNNENIRRDLTTDEGTLYSVAMIYDQPQGVREGLFVFTKYLEDTGLPMPKDTEEWLDVFAAMKDNGVQYPAGISSTGDIRGGAFANAFGTSLGSSYKILQETDELVYDGTSQELRGFLEYFKVLWDSGYVNPDFMYTAFFDMSLQTSGATGTFGGMNMDITSFKTNYDLDLSAAPPPHTTDSNGAPKMASYEYSRQQTSGMKNSVITTSCKNPEIALKYLDWYYSDEGIRVANYGWIEGESYEIVDGQPQLLPIMGTRDENGNSYSMRWALDEGPMYSFVNLRNPISAPEVVEAKKTWLSFNADDCLYMSTPGLSMSVEESEEISSVATDIASAVQTEALKFMTGESPLNDDTWDAYCNRIESMGLDRMTEIYKAAYERYKAR